MLPLLPDSANQPPHLHPPHEQAVLPLTHTHPIIDTPAHHNNRPTATTWPDVTPPHHNTQPDLNANATPDFGPNAGPNDTTANDTVHPSSTGFLQLPLQVGAYLLIREIGAGGMGRVYEALDTQLNRRVAVKFLRSGIAPAQATDRFIAESKILAKFTHPGIAQVFFAGHFTWPAQPATTSVAQAPYFVMEFVPGALSITEYAKRHDLSTAARVRLLIRVCDAIEHAHRHRIIHRDLKPSNIIIAENATSETTFVNTSPEGHRANAPAPPLEGFSQSSLHPLPEPKIIDFGIARPILSPTSTSPPGRDLAVAPAGTLEYMSPEQCSHTIPDERSDVYSLGVVLYQLLTGLLPYPALNTASTSEAITTIRTVRPRPLGDHNHSLRGDLEAIASHALAKSPTDRYPSVARLRTDLERYLNGEAVEARWSSVSYVLARRARGWVGLNPRTSLSITLIACLAIVLTVCIPLIFSWSKLHASYLQLQSSILGAPSLPVRAAHSILVTVTDDTNLAALTARFGSRGVDASGKPSFRAAFAALTQRLTRRPHAALVFDVRFEQANDIAAGPLASALLADALTSYEARRRSPAVAAGPFRPDGPAEIRISPAIEANTLLGVTLSDPIGGNLIAQLQLAAPRASFSLPPASTEPNDLPSSEQSNAADFSGNISSIPLSPQGYSPRMGLVVAGLAAADAAAVAQDASPQLAPAASDSPELEHDSEQALSTLPDTGPLARPFIGYISTAGPLPMAEVVQRASVQQRLQTRLQNHLKQTTHPGLPTRPPLFGIPRTISLADIQSVGEGYPKPQPQVGIMKGDEFGVMLVDIPADDFFTPITHEISAFLKHSDDDLDALIKDKLIFVADLRSVSKDFLPLLNGRTIPGVYTHVASAELLLADAHLTMLSPRWVISSAVVAALAGIFLAAGLLRRPARLLLCLLLVSLLCIAAALALFSLANIILSPFIPVAALTLSAIATSLILALRRQHRPTLQAAS